jgi:glycosyltransferase involved in cell wall biosynthesis
LAIVSTFNDQCGIAGYTRALLTQLHGAFEIEVFDLDQSLMRATQGNLLSAADAQINSFCDAFAGFDAVNIQLEYGTLGSTPNDISRRFKALVSAAPALSVTFHTILPNPEFPKDTFREQFFRVQIWNCYVTVSRHLAAKRFRKQIYDTLLQAQTQKPVSVIVHTPRDAKAMRIAEGFDTVYDHPLAFLTPEKISTLTAQRSANPHASLPSRSQGRVLVGVFGFLSSYKGIQTAIKALPLLPENHELAIFGGLHPGEIKPPEHGGPAEINPYLQSLLDEAKVDETYAQAIAKDGTETQSAAPQVALTKSPRNMQDRVHFMGVLDDDSLAVAMGAVDVVVLPYFETGQASSGPMSIATEMGARVIASRIQAFMQFDKYKPGRVTFFDAGNYLELAQRIQSVAQAPETNYIESYDTNSNREIYIAAHQNLASST